MLNPSVCSVVGGRGRLFVFVAITLTVLSASGCKKPGDTAAADAKSEALALVERLPRDPASARRLGVTRFEHVDDFSPGDVKQDLFANWQLVSGMWAVPSAEATVGRAKSGFVVTVRFRYLGVDADGRATLRRGIAKVNAVSGKDGKRQTTLAGLAHDDTVSLASSLKTWGMAVGGGTLMAIVGGLLIVAFVGGLTEVLGGRAGGCWDALTTLFFTTAWLLLLGLPFLIGGFAGAARGSYNALGGSPPAAVIGVASMLALMRFVWIVGIVIARMRKGGSPSLAAPPVAAPSHARIPQLYGDDLIGHAEALELLKQKDPVMKNYFAGAPEQMKPLILARVRKRVGALTYSTLVLEYGESGLADEAWGTPLGDP